MTPPTKLIFREWKKPEVTYELHGWRPDKALAFVIDDKGQPLVMEFVLPAQFNEHDRPTAAFSQSEPIHVTEIRLVPPPCRADQAEAHALRVRAKANTGDAGMVFPSANWDPARWELVRLSYDSEILILKPGDDVPLADHLDKFKEEKRREYGERKQEIHELLEFVRHRRPICGRARYYAHIVSNGYKVPSPDSAAVWQHFLNQDRIRLDIDFGQGGYQRGFLQWTPDDARRHPDIRDPFLQSRWAKENGLDLQQMALERKQIAAWTGTVDSGNSVSKLFKDALGDGFERMDFPTAPSPVMLDMAKAGDLEFGASIRFRVTFANESQETWLTACRRRGPEPHERAEFGAAQEKIVTMETIKDGQDKILTGIEALPKLVGEQSAASIAKEREKLEAVPGQLCAVGEHLATKVQGAAQTLRQVQKELQPTLDELETNQARLEAVMEEYKLKESPRQTQRALANHGVSKRIADFVLTHLCLGKAVPNAPTAARMLQKKYATNDGLNRKTVDRHFQTALPLLRAAGWPAHLLPGSKAGDSKAAGGTGSPRTDAKPEANPVTADDVAKLDSSDTLTAFERLQQQEDGSEDRT